MSIESEQEQAVSRSVREDAEAVKTKIQQAINEFHEKHPDFTLFMAIERFETRTRDAIHEGYIIKTEARLKA